MRLSFSCCALFDLFKFVFNWNQANSKEFVGSNGIGALIMLIGVSGGGFSYFVSVLLNFNLLSNTVPSSG